MINTGDATVDALIEGLLIDTAKIDKSEILFTFELTEALENDPEYTVMNEASMTRHREVFAHITALTGVDFREVSLSEEDADFYFTFREDVATAYVVEYEGGTLHVYNPDRSDPVLGSYEDHLILHEVGHGLGLEHGHGIGRLPDEFQGHSWTLMSYRAHPDTDSLFYGDSHGPETYMAADIAALQYLYGANFGTNAGDTLYQVDFATGEFYIDGAGQGAPIDNDVLRTVWDGAGTDTLDLSNAPTRLTIDLQPGAFTSFGESFLAYQGEGRFNNSLFAEGNIANPYLYEGNPASLLENAIGGRFRDNLIGNSADNILNGGGGNDSLFGLSGDDDLSGGGGDDLIVDGVGNTVADGGAGEDFIAALSGAGELNGGIDGDIIVGGIDDDSLQGGAGNDVLRGDAGSGLLFGNDTLAGGEGDDLLMGGHGADTFAFAPNEGANVIGSFDAGDLYPGEADAVFAQGADFESGIDQIFLSGFDGMDAGNVSDFIQNSAETGHAVFSAQGTSITFFGVDAATVNEEDFLFL